MYLDCPSTGVFNSEQNWRHAASQHKRHKEPHIFSNKISWLEVFQCQGCLCEEFIAELLTIHIQFTTVAGGSRSAVGSNLAKLLDLTESRSPSYNEQLWMLFLTLLWLHVSQQHSDNNLNFSNSHTLVTYGMTCSAHPQTQKGKQRQKSSRQQCKNHKAAKVCAAPHFFAAARLHNSSLKSLKVFKGYSKFIYGHSTT